MSPNLKPRRMPCLTQVLTRHPVAVAGSASAARTVPADNASRSRANTSRAALAVRRRTGGDELRDLRLEAHAYAPFSSPSSLSVADNLLPRLRPRCHERQPIDLLHQPHRRHRGLDRPWIGFDEIGEHQRHHPVVNGSGRRRSRCARPPRSSGRPRPASRWRGPR